MPSAESRPVAGRSGKRLRADRAVEIAAAGHGHAVNPAHAERRFEPLFTTRPAGSGLGPALSRNIIGNRGGAIAAGRPGGRVLDRLADDRRKQH